MYRLLGRSRADSNRYSTFYKSAFHYIKNALLSTKILTTPPILVNSMVIFVPNLYQNVVRVMARIIVFIKDSYTDKLGDARLLIEYTHLYERWRLNTGIKVNPSQVECFYDENLELWKLISKKKLKDEERKKFVNANNSLRDELDKLNKAIFAIKEKSLPLSPANVKAEYHKDPKKRIEKNNKSVLAWYSDFISAKENEIGAGINSYRSTYEHFKSFTQELGALHLNEMNKQFLENFRNYLTKLRIPETTIPKLQGPSIHKQFKNLRIFLNWILEQDEDDEIKIPQAYKKFNVKARYGDPIGLSIEQFAELCNLDLSKRIELDRTRDLFIFAVSIGGPRHGDLKKLGDSLRKNGFSMKQNSISYFESKTGNAHQEIMVNQFGLEILKKYDYSFPYVPTNQRMNQNLKTIAGLLMWEEIKQIPKYDNYGKLMKVEDVALMNIFSTKFMRKTAASIDNFIGIPTKTSMSRTGHKTFAAFSRYVDVNKESLTYANGKWDEVFNNFTKNAKKNQTLVEEVEA